MEVVVFTMATTFRRLQALLLTIPLLTTKGISSSCPEIINTDLCSSLSDQVPSDLLRRKDCFNFCDGLLVSTCQFGGTCAIQLVGCDVVVAGCTKQQLLGTLSSSPPMAPSSSSSIGLPSTPTSGGVDDDDTVVSPTMSPQESSTQPSAPTGGVDLTTGEPTLVPSSTITSRPAADVSSPSSQQVSSSLQPSTSRPTPAGGQDTPSLGSSATTASSRKRHGCLLLLLAVIRFL